MGGSGWGQDVWLGYRALRARMAASLTVVLTVAVAVGVTTAVFSVVNGVLLRPLPYPQPDRLMRVWQTKGGWMDSPNSQLRNFAQRFPLSVPTFNDWTAEDLGFTAMGAYSDRTYVSQQPDGADVTSGQAVTSGYFAALGIEPQLGRALAPEDDPPGAARVGVLSHGLWMERYGGDAGVLGQAINLDGTLHTIVGIMPASFVPPGGGARLWTPLTEESKAEARDSQFLEVVGRLAPGVTQEAAGERLAAFQKQLAGIYPDAQGDVGSRMIPYLDSVVGDVRSSVWLLLGAVGLVLVIACVNVANLLSVTSLTRRRELAVKAALGAGSRRLARGLLIECATLAALGGLGGVVLSRVWCAARPSSTNTSPPRWPCRASAPSSWSGWRGWPARWHCSACSASSPSQWRSVSARSACAWRWAPGATRWCAAWCSPARSWRAPVWPWAWRSRFHRQAWCGTSCSRSSPPTHWSMEPSASGCCWSPARHRTCRRDGRRRWTP
jgi:predicted permease